MGETAAALVISSKELVFKAGELLQWNHPWARRRRYGLAEDNGFYFYELKGKHIRDGKQPPHYLCCHCFDKRKMKILQRGGLFFWRCPKCQGHFGISQPPNHGPIGRVKLLR